MVNIKAARSLLKDVPLFPLDAEHPTSVKKVNNYIEEAMQGYGRASAISLLVYLSPATGEPLSFHVNARETQIRSMNAQTTINTMQNGAPAQVTVNFLDDLVYDNENLVVTPGSNPIHVFAAAVCEHNSRILEEAALPQYLDNYLQTWMSVDYETPSLKRTHQPIVLINQELRDVTVRDINQLHYVLNIPHYYKNTTVPVGESPQPIVFFKHVFDKLKLMPLHDASLLRKFICNDLGIPLFPETEPTLPIYAQWTKLSYFLQMCSPICLSPIEGGHRTLQMIKFFTGADFNTKSPQTFDPTRREDYPEVEMRPSMRINEHGLAMTAYNFTFWQRFDKNVELGRTDAGELQGQSQWFKESQKVSCQDTNDHFLKEVIRRLDAFYACEPGKEFTTLKFYKNYDDSYKTLDFRLKQAYPIILRCIQTVSPAKERWDLLQEAEKLTYGLPIPGKGAIPTFNLLYKSFVSVAEMSVSFI